MQEQLVAHVAHPDPRMGQSGIREGGTLEGQSGEWCTKVLRVGPEIRLGAVLKLQHQPLSLLRDLSPKEEGVLALPCTNPHRQPANL